MGPLEALMLATPIFGLALTPPAASLSPAALGTTAPAAALHAALPPLQVAQAAQAAEAEEEEGEGGGDAAAPAGGSGDLSLAEYGAMMRRRAEIRAIHKPLGIATWAAMGITLTLGFFQWHNLYGPFQPLENTPCVTGDGLIFGEGQCTGTPWVHLVSALVTTALYASTFTLSLLMPDPGGLDEGDSSFAKNLRFHKILRWVHFIGMVAQLGLGLVIANADSFGLDRANDYDALQALSAVHMGIGVVTFGAMTGAALLFLL
jgi:hypothetical protein